MPSHDSSAGGNRSYSDIAIEDRYQMLIDAVRDYAIFMLDPAGRVASWNSGAQRIKGYSPDEIIGRHFSTFYTPEDIAAGKPARELEIAATTGRVEDEGWRVRRDHSRFWANVVISAVRDASGTLLGFAKVTRDMTERTRLAALEHASEVTTQMQIARENEQKRIARELHDDLGQQLTALKMGVALLQTRLQMVTGLTEPLAEARELQAQVDTMAASLRRISADLRPPLLDDLGLSSALDWLVEDFSKRYGIRAIARVPTDSDTDEFAALTIFRIVQEALTNVARHSQAHTVVVSLKRAEDGCMLDISDDGVGAPPVPTAPRDRKSFGLLGMRERVRQLHGTITFDTKPGAGFSVHICFPESSLKGDRSS
ncbi:PAS domain S-box-containing protein [Paraburkholderia rhizosphaerae]|uniref:PAS domain S-box-containing protein n=2 Tax=Paraburkholderia rhizosphaerae TaxID=480658 RepID=A0A4R8LVX8_9BURK|nr:PAS domain-containing sensor histidine kinase [Paraburkholderia rhizosphaerae]TDY50947.1 PAS domain S-box-containing protein [Paraburkholderia rhizosphaerae]